MADILTSTDRFLRESSKVRLSKHCRNLEVTCSDISSEEDVEEVGDIFGDRMSSIILWGPVCKVTLKAHFGIETAISWAAIAMGVDEDEVEEQVAIDFIREFSNLHAGYLRGVFERVGLAVGISLPFVMAGDDEAIFTSLRKPGVHALAWKLSDGDRTIVCTAEVELTDQTRIASVIDKMNGIVDEEGRPNVDSDGDVEFLI